MIAISMAGESRRFSEAGYDVPKFMLDLGGRPVFDYAVGSFQAYFEKETFLFVCKASAGVPDFVERRVRSLGIGRYMVVALDRQTAGQAETIELGLRSITPLENLSGLTIFNIDTFRSSFRFRNSGCGSSGGYLEVFRGSGENWSFVRPDPAAPGVVLETAEKVAISDLCCTGLYHFSSAGYFLEALDAERRSPSARELYVAPLYNHLIRRGIVIHYDLVSAEDVVFCGVPKEYEALLSLGPEVLNLR